MAWTEDRWFIEVKAEDGSKRKEPSKRNGIGLRWRVRYETADGAERSKSFARKPDADRFCVKVGADLLHGTYLDPSAGKISLRKYADTWLDAQTFDESTRETVGRRLAHILPGLGDKRLDQLASSPSLIQAWIKGLQLAPSTVGQCIGVLSSILESAVADKRMPSNPCRSRAVRAPKIPKRKVVPLEAWQLAAVRDALPPRYRAMADAGAACGLRQGEIFGLAKEDIDFLRHTVHVVRQVKIVGGAMVFALPKGKKTRDVPLGDAAAERLSEHIRCFPPARVTLPWHEPGTRRHGVPAEADLMFTTPVARRPVHRQNFNYREWGAVLKAAGLRRIRENGMHVLRHTYASMLLHDGVDIRRVAACLGHDDPAFTLRVYMHLMEGGEDRVRQAIDRALTVPSPARKAKRSRDAQVRG